MSAGGRAFGAVVPSCPGAEDQDRLRAGEAGEFVFDHRVGAEGLFQ